MQRRGFRDKGLGKVEQVERVAVDRSEGESRECEYFASSPQRLKKVGENFALRLPYLTRGFGCRGQCGARHSDAEEQILTTWYSPPRDGHD